MRENLRHKPHVVYRAYSYDGTLLYVGLTHQLHLRMQQHKGSLLSSPWYCATTRITTEEVANGDLGVEREREVILTELPIFNVQGTGRWSPMVTGITYEPHGAAKAAA